MQRAELLDNEHATLMADGALMQGYPGEQRVSVAIVAGSFGRRCWLCARGHLQKLSALGELLLTIPIAKEAVIANAL